eukprot:TRINITY_DN21117_c0_g1_i1.p1 TRINITY_DN21117_c0_g1~~TRINITY_DN21117_c0_g1_i1.p1  ORF type:complete len:482 (+),score=68.43 TRINITY_DN21117_c0_g1_i1:138-1583(+)
MASSPPWRWPWKTTSYSSFRVPPLYTLSTFSSFQKKPRKTHLHHHSIFCLNTPNSPSPPSENKTTIDSNSETPSSTANKRSKKPTQISRSAEDGHFSIRAGEESTDEPFSTVGDVGKVDGKRSMWGSRGSWKRIFFASKKVRSIILLNILTLIYASDIPVLKEVEEIMDPALFSAVRFVLSTIPFLPFVLHARNDSQTRAAGLELGFWVSLAYLSQALGLVTADAGRASFISAFTVIAVPLIDGMLGATVPFITWFGALMSVIGVAMLESSGSPPSVGDLLNILSAVFFGIHMLRTEHFSRTTKKENILPLLGYEICVVAILSTIWYFLRLGFGDVHGLDSASWSWTLVWDWMVVFPWIPALYTGILSTGLCLWAEMAAMRDVSATETAIIYGLEPLWGAAFAWFLLGERWGTTGWVGAALILGGSLTVQILGSLTPEKPIEDDSNGQHDHLELLDKQSGLYRSTVVVSSRNNVNNLLKKK